MFPPSGILPSCGRWLLGLLLGLALLGPAVPYAQVADVVEDIAAAYVELRARPDELFIETVKRTGVEPFRERVYATR